MTELEKGREAYEKIDIPEEFRQNVTQAVYRSRMKQQQRENRGRQYRRVAVAAAIFMALLTVALNTNDALAMEAGRLPVIGGLVKIMTVRSYVQREKEMRIVVEVPQLDLGESDNGLSEAVNEQIARMTSQYEAEALQRAEEYREAFITTGGTEEEWAAHDIRIKVWYEIMSQTEDTLSFAVKGRESWTTAYAQSRYYNLDLRTNTFLSLEDLLGEDYITIANEQIRAQIEERTREGAVFLSVSEGGFTSIRENMDFYINDRGNPVVVFEKYAIAPGAMGEVEFEIRK